MEGRAESEVVEKLSHKPRAQEQVGSTGAETHALMKSLAEMIP